MSLEHPAVCNLGEYYRLYNLNSLNTIPYLADGLKIVSDWDPDYLEFTTDVGPTGDSFSLGTPLAGLVSGTTYRFGIYYVGNTDYGVEIGITFGFASMLWFCGAGASGGSDARIMQGTDDPTHNHLLGRNFSDDGIEALVTFRNVAGTLFLDYVAYLNGIPVKARTNYNTGTVFADFVGYMSNPALCYLWASDRSSAVGSTARISQLYITGPNANLGTSCGGIVPSEASLVPRASAKLSHARVLIEHRGEMGAHLFHNLMKEKTA